MALYSLKPRFQTVLRGVEVGLVARGVHADWLTAGAVGAAALAAGLHALGWQTRAAWLWAVPLLALVRITLNALDGQVARRSGTARPWGAVLNEMGDRVADLLFVGSVVLVGPVAAELGVAALSAMLLSSLTGLLGPTIGGPRLTLGIFAKADRMVGLAVLYGVALALGTDWPLTLYVGLVAVGSLVTLAQRLERLKGLAGA